MPKGRLSEHKVRDAALHFLESFYQDERGADHVVAQKEVVVKPAFGRGRADGVVAFIRPEGEVFVASLEAKSCKTLGSLLFTYRDGPWLLHGASVGSLAALVAWFAMCRVDFWLWRWGVPVGVFFATAAAYLKVTAELSHYKAVGVVKQVQRYPAHEQWVAFSTDAFNSIPSDHQAEIMNKCKVHNIGLLLVSPGAKCRVLHEPIAHASSKNPVDYLERYVRSDSIRKALETRSSQCQPAMVGEDHI